VGTRGPKKTPAGILAARGNPGKRPLQTEVQPPSLPTMPEPPPILHEWGKKVWFEYGPILMGVGLLTAADIPLFSLYCEAWDDFVMAKQMLDEQGLVLVSEKGGSYTNPAFNVKANASNRIAQYGERFLLSPTARSANGKPGGGKKDDLADFLTEGN